ncbi:MAG: hypothetical protein J0I23_07850 [Rhizobiales bacterium]|nr:hypothetical protein [Hyphomicrobiales bacterium]
MAAPGPADNDPSLAEAKTILVDYVEKGSDRRSCDVVAPEYFSFGSIGIDSDVGKGEGCPCCGQLERFRLDIATGPGPSCERGNRWHGRRITDKRSEGFAKARIGLRPAVSLQCGQVRLGRHRHLLGRDVPPLRPPPWRAHRHGRLSVLVPLPGSDESPIEAQTGD